MMNNGKKSKLVKVGKMIGLAAYYTALVYAEIKVHKAREKAIKTDLIKSKAAKVYFEIVRDIKPEDIYFMNEAHEALCNDDVEALEEIYREIKRA